MRATIIIPTIRRLDSLSNALSSVMALKDHSQIEQLVAVDNDPLGSAKLQVEALAENAPFPVLWVHEPRPGVANARNAGVAVATAPFIAFLDDDETASSQWLTELLRVQSATNADVVFGPIAGIAPDASNDIRPFIEDFFSRIGPDEDGLIERTYGCGNSLFKRSSTLNDEAPFDQATNETGGEDDLLFAALKTKHCSFAWAANAWVTEHVPSKRANMDYVLKRAFAYGQGPSQSAAEQGHWLGVVRWMLVGSAQIAVFAPTALICNVLARPRYPKYLRRTYEGAGKLLWFKGLEPKFYGSHELER